VKAKEFVARRQTVGEFADLNRKDLDRLARHILKRWPAPNDVGPEDVTQELLLECWRLASSRKFDPTRGVTPERFLTYNAVSKAKRYVHRARRAKGDRDFGRFEVLTATGDVTSDISNIAATGEADAEFMRRERLRELLAKCQSVREAVCLMVFYEEESTTAAGDRIYRTAELRDLCRVRCAREARDAVKQTVEEHAGCQR
jgi:DNA-directed RNA polymerase specialized sigma24 family protein